MKKLVILFLVIGYRAFAVDVTVPPNQTSTVTLANDGDTLTVEDGGVINTNAGSGVDMSNTNQVVTVESGGEISASAATGSAINSTASDATIVTESNSVVSATGSQGHGIFAQAGNATITHGGSIVTTSNLSSGIFSSSTGTTLVLQNGSSVLTGGEDAFGIFSTGANATVTTENGSTITTTGTQSAGVNATGTAFTLTHGGAITTTDGSGIFVDSSGSSATIVTTSGSTIDASGNQRHGIFFEGNDSSVTHGGAITTSGNLASGIYSTSSLSTITTNSGSTITTSGPNGEGIYTIGVGMTVVNNGIITTTGSDAYGVRSEGEALELLNRGSLITSGVDSYGISASGNFNIVTNQGSVTTSGNGAHGVSVTAQSVTLTNSGSISVTGSGATGVAVSEDQFTLINAGTISSPGFAIDISGNNPELGVLNGSVIDGAIRSSADTLDLSVAPLMATTLITVQGQGLGDLNIAQPFAQLSNNSVLIVSSASLDASFSMQTDILEDLSDSILNIIYTNEYNLLNCCSAGCGVWVAGMGTTRRRNETVLTRNWQGGGMIGATIPFCCDSALGGFIGGSWGSGRVEGDVASVHPKSYFGGLTYETLWCNTFVGAAVAGGYFELNSRRQVINNLAAGGVQTATADGQGGMFTAEVTASRWVWCPIWCMRPLATLTLRYAGLYLGDYNESGSGADLYVKSRNINLLKPKFMLGFQKVGCSCELGYSVQPYVGYAGRFQVGGTTVNTEILNLPFDFGSGNTKSVGELLYGLYGNLFLGERNVIFCHFQGLNDTASSARFLGEGGWNYRY